MKSQKCCPGCVIYQGKEPHRRGLAVHQLPLSLSTGEWHWREWELPTSDSPPGVRWWSSVITWTRTIWWKRRMAFQQARMIAPPDTIVGGRYMKALFMPTLVVLKEFPASATLSAAPGICTLLILQAAFSLLLHHKLLQDLFTHSIFPNICPVLKKKSYFWLHLH